MAEFDWLLNWEVSCKNLSRTVAKQERKYQGHLSLYHKK
jgi:hypothetical protein